MMASDLELLQHTPRVTSAQLRVCLDHLTRVLPARVYGVIFPVSGELPGICNLEGRMTGMEGWICSMLRSA